MSFAALFMGESSEWMLMLFSLWVKSIIVLATTALLTTVVRATSARSRHLLWCAALSSLLVLPLFSISLQPVSVPILPSVIFSNEIAPQQISRKPKAESSGQTVTVLVSHAGSQFVQNAGSRFSTIDDGQSPYRFSSALIVLLVWLIGVLLV